LATRASRRFIGWSRTSRAPVGVRTLWLRQPRGPHIGRLASNRARESRPIGRAALREGA
jgi:hypothetical protein